MAPRRNTMFPYLLIAVSIIAIAVPLFISKKNLWYIPAIAPTTYIAIFLTYLKMTSGTIDPLAIPALVIFWGLPAGCVSVIIYYLCREFMHKD